MSEAKKQIEEPSAPPQGEETAKAKPSLLMAPVIAMRWLYEWVMSWSDRKGGTVALAGISFAESSFFPIPPDPLLVAMCLGNQKKSIFFSFVTTVASVLGAIAGWMIGLYFFQEVADWILELMGQQELWYGTIASLDSAEYAGKTAIENQGMVFYPDGKLYEVKEAFDEYGMWALFIAAVTPLPFKVATVASGFFSLGLGPMILGSTLGRSLRFMSMGVLFHYFGEWARSFLERYFAPISIISVIFGVGGFIAVKYVF